MKLSDTLSEFLEQKKLQGLYRQREVVQGPQGIFITIENRQYLSFCSNDYLGLANDPELIATLQQSAARFGVGSGAAHLITGHVSPHHELECALAEHLGRSSALLFSTGYMANIGLLTSLAQRGDLILQDKINHASLIDGGQYSAATLKRYRHVDVEQLESYLSRAEEKKRFVVTDGVFSMDGDIAPLPDIMTSAAKYNATVIVDDAHGIGVLGDTGGGVCEYFDLKNDDEPVIMGTLGKAVGVAGAFVAGSSTLIDYLVQTARTYVYTTAMPACLAAASLVSLRKIQQESWRREHLQALIYQFRQGCEHLGLHLLPSTTPIQPIILGETKKAVRWSEALRQQGILVKAIRPPTVPNQTARLRVTFSAAHTKQHVQTLLNALEQLA